MFNFTCLDLCTFTDTATAPLGWFLLCLPVVSGLKVNLGKSDSFPVEDNKISQIRIFLQTVVLKDSNMS
jgi:hypothetical protein